jgi:hypothetical protein
MSVSYSPWTPLPNLKGEFALEELHYDGEELYLRLLSDSNRAIEVKVSFPLQFSFIDCESSEADVDLTFGPFWASRSSEFSSYKIFSSNHGFISFEVDVEPHVSWVDNFFGDAT